jgi:hypothetical protein
MTKTILAVCLLSCFTAQASEWDKTEKGLLIAAETLLVMDMQQTLQIEGKGLRELNPILGEHPSNAKIYGYFALSGLVTYAIADRLSPEWRKMYLSGVVGFQIAIVKHNVQMGLSLKF